ncbi:ABC transporter substrate-binding protein [Oscillospiraceae bacterium MB08-C2-2]|nr:ABC transporter substrate-binding protein [Oscillospiraceae bacterium MB08-C2-2]
MRKFTAMLLTISIALMSLAGCAGGGSASSSAAASQVTSSGSASAENPDSIVAYVGTTIFDSSLNPVKGAMSYGYPFTNAALLKVNPASEYVGDMATEWGVSENALTYTFKLREGVKFSDGSDMTAEDVVFTYETVKANQAENENVDLTKLASVKALDEYTVEFTLSEPYSPFLDTTSMLGIVPSDSYNSESFEHSPIGTGPWKVAQYDANQQIIVEPNQYYYEGAPSIDRVTLVYMDNDAALSAARSGQLDIVMVSPNYAAETVEGMTMFPMETMDIRQISLPVLPEQEHEGMKVGNNVTSDKNVRQALAIGIDRKTIIQNAFNGIGKPAVGFTSNLIWANGDSYEDNRKDEARALLESAGWVDSDGDGFREKDGVVCEFDVYAAEDRYVLAAALAENAAELGIKINPHSSNWDDISANMNTSGVVWGWGQYSPTVIASLFHSDFAFSGGYNNVVAYSNPEVDKLIDQALSEVTQEAAIADWKQVQAVAKEDYPYLYIVNIEHCYFVSDRLELSEDTQIPHPHGHGSPIICNMKDWTLK